MFFPLQVSGVNTGQAEGILMTQEYVSEIYVFSKKTKDTKFVWTLPREDLESDLPNRPPEVSLRAALPPVGASRRTLLEDASVSAKSSRGHAPARPSSHPEDSDPGLSYPIAQTVKAPQVLAGG